MHERAVQPRNKLLQWGQESVALLLLLRKFFLGVLRRKADGMGIRKILYLQF